MFVTTCCIISTFELALLPVMVFSRKKFNLGMIELELLLGTMGLVSDFGWMTSKILPEVFITSTLRWKFFSSLLIMDNHESHLTKESVTIAKPNGMTILALLPHTSNRLQLWDVTAHCFYKKWLTDHFGIPLSSFDVASCVNYAFEKVMLVSKTKWGFQTTEIYPFDKFVLTDDDFIISGATDRRHKTQETE